MTRRTVIESSTTSTSGRSGAGGSAPAGHGGTLAAVASASRRLSAPAAGLLAVHRRQRHRVVDQHHGARSQHRHAGQAGQARQLRPEVLDHHFLVAQHFVHVHGDALRGAAEDHHRCACRRGSLLRGATAAARRPEEGQLLAAEIERRRCCRPAATPRPSRGAPSRPGWQARRPSRLPQRSITTCVTAVVSGSTSLKLVPCPAAVVVSMRPPSAFTSERTTSMPMPRPDSSVTCVAVEKPGMKIRLASSASSCSCLGVDQPLLQRLVADARQVEAGAVVAELHRDVVAFLVQRR